VAHQNRHHQPPSKQTSASLEGRTSRNRLPPRSRARRPSSGFPPRLGPDLSGESPPCSGVSAPRAGLRLTRGFQPLERVSASLEASPRPAAPHLLPDRSIKRPATPRVLGSKANPRHANLLTQPGNLTPALFEQPTTVQPSLRENLK
jgi:hypothetical protein